MHADIDRASVQHRTCTSLTHVHKPSSQTCETVLWVETEVELLISDGALVFAGGATLVFVGVLDKPSALVRCVLWQDRFPIISIQPTGWVLCKQECGYELCWKPSCCNISVQHCANGTLLEIPLSGVSFVAASKHSFCVFIDQGRYSRVCTKW